MPRRHFPEKDGWRLTFPHRVRIDSLRSGIPNIPEIGSSRESVVLLLVLSPRGTLTVGFGFSAAANPYSDLMHETLFVRVIALHLSMVTLRLVTQMLV